jgi:threonine synthase
VLVNSVNPHRIEGQKTAAFEIVDELDGPPGLLALPYGGGGNTCAYALGFEEAGAGMPTIVAAEAQERATTVASAIRITRPVHAEAATEAIRASGGGVVTLGDDEILAAWRALAHEGLFCEPASAAGFAALAHVEIEPGSRVVCVLTGHGLKDPAPAAEPGPPPIVVDPDPDAIAEASR